MASPAHRADQASAAIARLVFPPPAELSAVIGISIMRAEAGQSRPPKRTLIASRAPGHERTLLRDSSQ